MSNVIDRNQNTVGGSIDSEAAVLIDLNLDNPVESGKMGIAEGADQLIFDMLTDISAKPGVYALREAYSNAYDATKKTGDMSRPIEIDVPFRSAQSAPTGDSDDAFANRLAAAIGGKGKNDEFDDCSNIPMITVTDHGCGMTADDLRSYFMMYGGSKKRGDYEMIGSKGLGCKAPIAISPVFYVTTRKDGIECQATITRSDSGSTYNIVKSKTDKGDGTTISIPVLTDKILADLTECVETLIDCNYDANLVVNGEAHGRGKVIEKDMYNLGELEVAKTSDGEPVKMDVFIPDYTYPFRSVDGFVVIIGGYPYAVGDCNGFTTYYSDYRKNGRRTYAPSYIGHSNVFTVPVVIGEPGFLNFTPSRDEIKRDGACDAFRNAVSDAIVNCDWTQPVIDYIDRAKAAYDAIDPSEKPLPYMMYCSLFKGPLGTRMYQIDGFDSFDIVATDGDSYDCVCNGVNVKIPRSAIDIAGYNPFVAYRWGLDHDANAGTVIDDNGNKVYDHSYMNDGKPHVNAFSSVFNRGSDSRYCFTCNGSGTIKKKQLAVASIVGKNRKLPTLQQLGGMPIRDINNSTRNRTQQYIAWVVYGCTDDDLSRFINRFADFEYAASNGAGRTSRTLTIAAYAGQPDDEFNGEVEFLRNYSFDEVKVLSVAEMDAALTEARTSRTKKRDKDAIVASGLVKVRYAIDKDADYRELVSREFPYYRNDDEFDGELTEDVLRDNLIVLADNFSGECVGAASVIAKLVPEYSEISGVIVIRGATKPVVSALAAEGAKFAFDVRNRVPSRIKTIADELGFEHVSDIPSTLIPDDELGKLTGFTKEIIASSPYGKSPAYDFDKDGLVQIDSYSYDSPRNACKLRDISESGILSALAKSGNFPELTASLAAIDGTDTEDERYSVRELNRARNRSVRFDFRHDERVKRIIAEQVKPAAAIYKILDDNGFTDSGIYSYGRNTFSDAANAAVIGMLTKFVNDRLPHKAASTHETKIVELVA